MRSDLYFGIYYSVLSCPVLVAKIGILLMAFPRWVLAGSVFFFSLIPSALAEGVWVEEMWRGCKVWNVHPEPRQTVTWTGPCVDGYIEGAGELRWFLDNKASDWVSGVAINGRLIGKARIQRADGSVSEFDYGSAPGGKLKQAEKLAGWLEDKRGGCKIWNPRSRFGDSVSWSGACKDGFANGYGEAAWYDKDSPGNVVRGSVVRGRFKGRVQVRYQSGELYSGALDAAGNRNGEGTFVRTDGVKYQGGFFADAFHGRGKVSSPNGRVIVANWARGEVLKVISEYVPKPFDKECSDYGFSMGTTAFAECRMKLAEAQQQLNLMARQYELQREIYQQQVAAYNAQQQAIREERERKRREALLRLGLGMMNSQSPTFAGGLRDGINAMYGVPIQPPVAPRLDDDDLHPVFITLPNGRQVTCHRIGPSINCR